MSTPDRFRRLFAIGSAAALLASAVAAPANAAGKVDVRWLQPERYADAGRSAMERESAMSEIGDFLRQLARRLPDGQTLSLEITELDLAGELEPVGWHELRVLRGRADWPRMNVRYTLSAAGSTLRSGEARLSDMGYAFSPRQGSLGYEKHMIERWFKAEFVAP